MDAELPDGLLSTARAELRALAGASPAVIVERLVARVEAFVAGPLQDDLRAVVVRPRT